MKRSILTTAAIFAALMFAGSATAADFHFTDAASNQSFSDSNNWESGCPSGTGMGTIPGVNDRIIICSGKTCNVDTSATVQSIEVPSDGLLNIQPSYTLTLNNGSSEDSEIDGEVNLESSGGYGILEFVTNDHEITGDGLIIGAHHSCQIRLSSDYLDLTSGITIEGLLEITAYDGASDTTFVNNGYVHANAAGTLDIDPGQIGVSSGVWCVSTSASAILQINAPSAGKHSGNICISKGTLDINETFTTSGSLNYTGGTIDVASGKTLSADGNGSCVCCW